MQSCAPSSSLQGKLLHNTQTMLHSSAGVCYTPLQVYTTHLCRCMLHTSAGVCYMLLYATHFTTHKQCACCVWEFQDNTQTTRALCMGFCVFAWCLRPAVAWQKLLASYPPCMQSCTPPSSLYNKPLHKKQNTSQTTPQHKNNALFVQSSTPPSSLHIKPLQNEQKTSQTTS